MRIITVEELAMAMVQKIGMKMEDAMKDANFVMDLFGFEDRIIDNILGPSDRQLFYLLEEEGILITEREETTIYDGRSWRTHYWILNRDAIYGYKKEEKVEEKKEEVNIYKEIPEEAWKRGSKIINKI
jgi:hypothetical protein